MSAADNGRVALRPAASLRCPMIPQIDSWVTEVVEPAARYYFRQDLVELSVLASYSCRPMNSVDGAQISEHAYANAIDVGGFKLSNGEKISVLEGWNGSEREQAFHPRRGVPIFHDRARAELQQPSRQPFPSRPRPPRRQRAERLLQIATAPRGQGRVRTRVKSATSAA
jgi:hypothetical protein